MALSVRRLSGALGAELRGVDLKQPLDERAFAKIHSLFLGYVYEETL
jgi:hypothetical protein